MSEDNVFEFKVRAETLECECGIVFSVPKRFIEAKRGNYGTFWCPAGCQLNYKRPQEEPPQKPGEEKKEERGALIKFLDYMKGKK